MFYRWRTIKGGRYLYQEERYRENGKVKSRSTLVKGGAAPMSPRKAADERYREVLRDNVYKYGTSRPGERYVREAKARERYHRDLDKEKQRASSPAFEARPVSPFEARSRMYDVSHPSAKYRAHEEQSGRREAAEKEARENSKASYPPKGSPTDEEEAARSDAKEDIDNWSGNVQAEYEANTDD